MATVFFIIIKSMLFLLHPNLDITVEKDFLVRWLLYIDTLKMIMENPLGVGVGQYEFSSVPYLGNLFPSMNELYIFLSPHNEFLHFLAEDGVIMSFLSLLLFWSLVSYFWRDIKQTCDSYPEFIFFSIMLLVQSTFQFPLIEPLSYLMTAIIIGYFFSLTTKKLVTYELNRGLRFILIGANFFAFFVFINYFASRYISFTFPKDIELNKIACSSVSRDWYACLNVSSSYLDKGDYKNAEAYAVRVLDWQPDNYQGMKMLGFALLYQGRYSEACSFFITYDSLFQQKSSLHKLIKKECKSYL